MKRWWISWYEPVDEQGDYRAIRWPLADGIKKYWCSGWTGDGKSATLCAVIDAATEDEAKQIVRDHWKPGEWRFCEEKPLHWRPGDRFPWADVGAV